jgi:23S rRNA pseudouridine2605 synthase
LTKKYIVSVSEKIFLEKFNKEVYDNGEVLKIFDIRESNKFTYEVSLKTGKNKEIRRIFDSNNIKINNLKRISIGTFKLGNLKIGELKEIYS